MSEDLTSPDNLRCVCFNIDLAFVLSVARRKEWTRAPQVFARLDCGNGCQSCRPYIARMLATGEVPTNNDLMSQEELVRWQEEAERG